MHLHNDHIFLQKDALWVIVDPWLNQPEKDQIEYLELGIDINQHNHIFLDKLFHDIQHAKNVVVFQEATSPIHDLFKDYPRYSTIRQLSIDAKIYSDIVFCGMHYGMCIHSAVTRLQKSLPDINYYVKRDLSCVMPLENPHQSDKDLLYHNIQII